MSKTLGLNLVGRSYFYETDQNVFLPDESVFMFDLFEFMYYFRLRWAICRRHPT